MNKCNYNNSLDTTKHMFVIVKPLTNQVIVNSRSIGNARFFQLVLKYIFRNQYYHFDNYNLCRRRYFGFRASEKTQSIQKYGGGIRKADIKLMAEYFEPIEANIRAFKKLKDKLQAEVHKTSQEVNESFTSTYWNKSID